MVFGTTAAIILGSLAAAAGAGVTSTLSSSAQSKAKKQADQAAAKAQQDAEQKALLASQAEQANTKARQSLLDTPTSGFGPNPNLARSFLTTL